MVFTVNFHHTQNPLKKKKSNQKSLFSYINFVRTSMLLILLLLICRCSTCTILTYQESCMMHSILFYIVHVCMFVFKFSNFNAKLVEGDYKFTGFLLDIITGQCWIQKNRKIYQILLKVHQISTPSVRTHTLGPCDNVCMLENNRIMLQNLNMCSNGNLKIGFKKC